MLQSQNRETMLRNSLRVLATASRVSVFIFCTVSFRQLICSSVVWVAYAFYAVPLICSLAKLNVTATTRK